MSEPESHDRLRRMILAEDASVVINGRLLPERALSAALGMGRAELRQVLGRLEAEGLILRRQGQGTFLAARPRPAAGLGTITSRTSPLEIMEVRRAIEPQLARIAALRATPADIDHLRRDAEAGRAATNGQDYERLDSQFHSRIAECARNSLFLEIFHIVASVRTRQNWSGMRDKTFSVALRDDLVQQHLEIVDAIALREPDLAQDRMARHLGFVLTMVGG